MIYNKINWENEPSTNTPISAENLNVMDNGIDLIASGLNNFNLYDEIKHTGNNGLIPIITGANITPGTTVTGLGDLSTYRWFLAKPVGSTLTIPILNTRSINPTIRGITGNAALSSPNFIDQAAMVIRIEDNFSFTFIAHVRLNFTVNGITENTSFPNLEALYGLN